MTTGAPELHLRLTADDHAPAHAREAIRQLDGAEWVLGDAMLVASELVTDAVRSGPAGEDRTIALALERHEDRLLISVTGEQGSEPPEPTGSPLSDNVGLRVVEALSIRCGIELDWARRTWAELALPLVAGG